MAVGSDFKVSAQKAARLVAKGGISTSTLNLHDCFNDEILGPHKVHSCKVALSPLPLAPLLLLCEKVVLHVMWQMWSSRILWWSHGKSILARHVSDSELVLTDETHAC